MADFYKYHGLGNDYLVIDPKKLSFKFDLSKKNISLICNRHYGIGSDGILYGPIIDNNKIRFQIFNPDGSEAEKSGNGIRIFALYLINHAYVKEPKFDLYTKGGKVSVELIDANSNLIKVNMGQYSFMSAVIPTLLGGDEVLNREIEVLGKMEKINCVNVGNPHCVIFKEKATAELAKTLGPELENNKFFPNKINVQIAELIDESNIKIEIWERGAGYTLASGTSSLAASCVAHKLGFVSNNISVHMPGGKVNVEIVGNDVYLTGTAERVFNGFFDTDFRKEII